MKMIKLLIFDLDDTLYPDKVKTIDIKKVKSMLEKLRKDYHLILLTNDFKFSVLKKINDSEYNELFSKIYNPNFFINRKPLTFKFKKIIKEFNVNKNNVLMVGNTVYTDMLFAKFCGIKSVLITNGKKKKTIIKPDYTINSILDLERILSRL